MMGSTSIWQGIADLRSQHHVHEREMPIQYAKTGNYIGSEYNANSNCGIVKERQVGLPYRVRYALHAVGRKKSVAHGIREA